MAHRGGQFVRRIHEAAVAVDGQHGHVTPRVLRAEGGRISPSEIVLIARRKIGARLQDWKAQTAGEPDLGDLVDEDAVGGQRGADGVQKADLRFKAGQAVGEPGAMARQFF